MKKVERNQKSRKVLIILSGGMDSSVLLFNHLHQGDMVRALSINYGQRHAKELIYARDLCNELGVLHQTADLRSLADLLPGSSQTDRSVPVPEGHYSEESMKATVVPNRNMIMLSVALGVAVAHKLDGVSYAAHAGDHAIYPDCREDFVAALNEAAKLCDWHPVQIFRPFIKLTKAQIVKIGGELGVRFDDTWSCYKGEDLHCGRCGTCVERREAFHLAGEYDPTLYASGAPTVDEMVAKGWKL